MHLYDEMLDSYLARDLPPQTLSVIDAHVSNCLACAHALADAHNAAEHWERRGLLGRLVRVDGPSMAKANVEERQAEAA